LFLGFFIALSITALIIPLLARVAGIIGLNDSPGPRKVHSTPVPRVGGIAMTVGMAIALLFGTDLAPELVAPAIAVLVLLVFGVLDDRCDLDYRVKFGGQLLAILLCLLLSDLRIDSITLDTRYALPAWSSTILTLVFLLGVTNAVNLSDGLDGLAGGMALLCICGIALMALSGGNLPVVGVALVMAGAIIGFLRFNTHPARVFMGDCGSQILGFAMGWLAILTTQAETTAVSAALPLLLIGVPIVDTLSVIYLRLRDGRSPFSADRNHLHHRLLALGLRHAEAVSTVYLLQGVMFLLAYFMRFESDLLIGLSFLALSVGVLGSLSVAEKRGWRIRRERADQPAHGFVQGLRGHLNRMGLQQVAGGVLLLSAASYAGLVATRVAEVQPDLAMLSLALAGMLLIATRARANVAAWLDRAVAYTTVLIVVYLDQQQVMPSALSWLPPLSLPLIAAFAAVLRLMLASDQTFRANSLDLLVLFIAIVVLQLPGPMQLPAGFAAGAVKAVLLLYVAEMSLAASGRRFVLRTLLGVILVAFSLRALIGMQL